MVVARRRRVVYGDFALPSFEGGLNLRDAATELAPNETPDCWNVTTDERGGIVKRLGYTKWNASAVGNLITGGYYSRVADKLLWYSKADGKLYSDPGTGVLTLRRTWTTGSDIGLTDFAGKVYAIHPVDGLYSSSDGVTWSSVSAASGSIPSACTILAVWQNKLWTAGNGVKVSFSAAGDATKWASADGGGSNDIREGRDGDASVVALFGATGVDFQGDPSLLVFKNNSTHRITDSSTGAYVTIDASNGAAGQNSVATAYGRIYVLSTKGIFETDGFAQLSPVGAKLEPQFTPAALDYTTATYYAAGVQQNHLYFSVRRHGASANDLALEYNPLFKSFTARSDAAAVYVSYTKQADTLLAASPTVAGQVFQLNTGGSDNTAAIVSRFLTRPLEINSGLAARIQRTVLKMRGTLKLQILADFSTTGEQETLMVGVSPGFIWGSGLWGAGVWGAGDKQEDYATALARPYGTAFQFRVDETSTDTGVTMPLLESGASLAVGAWALYGISGSYSPISSI